ncbi:MAG: hypothetical protein K6C34_05505 [Alphaproteobacteria bacterium]|nr:hypothetical protein [Alphaproteobacteria bacterium]
MKRLIAIISLCVCCFVANAKFIYEPKVVPVVNLQPGKFGATPTPVMVASADNIKIKDDNGNDKSSLFYCTVGSDGNLAVKYFGDEFNKDYIVFSGKREIAKLSTHKEEGKASVTFFKDGWGLIKIKLQMRTPPTR